MLYANSSTPVCPFASFPAHGSLIGHSSFILTTLKAGHGFSRPFFLRYTSKPSKLLDPSLPCHRRYSFSKSGLKFIHRYVNTYPRSLCYLGDHQGGPNRGEPISSSCHVVPQGGFHRLRLRGKLLGIERPTSLSTCPLLHTKPGIAREFLGFLGATIRIWREQACRTALHFADHLSLNSFSVSFRPKMRISAA